MAQMAPALAEAAGSPSPNADIPSSNVQDPLRLSSIREAVKNENSRLHIDSVSLNHNGICRSLTNCTSTTKSVSCVMENVHKLNKFTYARQKSMESTVCTKPDSQIQCQTSRVEKTNDRDKINSLSSKKEMLVSTPTRIPPITTTKTCARNSPQVFSSCGVSVDEMNDEVNQRHSFAGLKSPSKALLDKKVTKIGCNQTRLFSRARKLERRLRTLQTRQLESHVCDQLTSLSVSRRKSRTTQSELSSEQLDSKIHPNFRRCASHIVKEESSREKRQQNSLTRENKLNLNRSPGDAGKLGGQIGTDFGTLSCSNLTGGYSEAETDVARTLVCQLELVENVGDSDATLSSSGGESCDEMDDRSSSNEFKT